VDLDKLIEKLTQERAALDEIIASLEQLQSVVPVERVKKRRGRKFMGEAERQDVSARMKKYWAARLAQNPQR
jgi:hypothetical protein